MDNAAAFPTGATTSATTTILQNLTHVTPPWFAALLPIGEGALAGGALLGLVMAVVTYAVAWRALRGRSTSN